MGLLEQWRYLIIGKASYAATYASNQEGQLRMLPGKLDELINVGFDSFYPTLHGWDAIALPLQTNALAHNSAKLAVSNIRCAATMHTTKITAKHEYLVRLK